jgi:hypothetical protein
VNAELLLLFLLALVVLAYLRLGRYQKAGRRTPGLDRGELAYADDSLVRRPQRRAQRLQLAGRPGLLEKTDGTYVPVEPGAQRQPRVPAGRPHVVRWAAPSA